MRNIFFVSFLLILLSCKRQEKDDLIKSKKSNKMIEKLDIIKLKKEGKKIPTSKTEFSYEDRKSVV